MSENSSTGLLDSSSNSFEDYSLSSNDEMFKKVEEQFLGSLLEDQYLLEEPLGRGSSGVVFAATDIKSLEKVAVKVFVQDLNAAGRGIHRFNQETRTTRYLKHRNILEIYSYGVEKNHPYFVMEYLAGGSLFDLLKKSERLSADEAIELIKQVASALVYAHREGVVHRDIKPSNIIFKDEDRKHVKLVDFGMSTRLSWDYSDDVFRTPTGQIYGTTLYMSPEQSKGSSTDKKTDVYSLGCVFYECLTGMPPHLGKTAIDIVVKHQKEEIIPVNQAAMTEVVSVEIQTVVDKMLRKSLKDRYQSCELILRDLDAIEKGFFDHNLYLTPEKEEPQFQIVRDYSNIVFILALLSVLATVAFAGSILFFNHTVNDDQSTSEAVHYTEFDITSDTDLRQIRECIFSMFSMVRKEIVDPDRFMNFYTPKWRKNGYALMMRTWDKPSLEFNSDFKKPYVPVGTIELESIDKNLGKATVIVDTSPWVRKGPKSMKLKLIRIKGKWLIDKVQMYNKKEP